MNARASGLTRTAGYSLPADGGNPLKLDVRGIVPRGNRDRSPGTILGEKRIACARCGREFPESRLSTIPRDAVPGDPRVYVCEECR